MSKYNDLPIIALTAGVTKEEQEDVLLAGLSGLILKPIQHKLLAENLLKWIKK
jgi:CheY-like chemotaxis protein